MKAIRIVLAFVLSLGLFSVSTASAAVKPIDRYDFWDVDPSHQFYDAIERFIYSDLIDGYVEKEVEVEDGETYEYSFVTVRPNENITRAQFTKILVNALSLKAGNKSVEFSDVKSSRWYYDYVRIASSNGIVTGSNGKFNPDANITRDQMAAMIYRAFKGTVVFKTPVKTFKDVPATSFAYEAVTKSAANGIIRGYGDLFKPHEKATRGQAIVMIDRALQQEAGTADDRTAVKEVVERNTAEESRLMAAGDLSGLDALYKETATGYYLSLATDESLMFTEDDFEEGVTYSIEQIGTHTVSPGTVHKRFAQARIDNLKYKVSFTAPDMSFTINIDASGTAHLKKGSDGKWKIYNIVLDEEFEETLEDEFAAAAANAS
ncbi:S-layer homology domain-containing protein [Domibacillus indicus]|uniref:S-layer homology domain-containing protein n=1 Tax=Domibacillus indicus TaxID=1437523 RepID=UPI000617F451|nr:S-layer homology domain-containing protein [Domibacillus indicus]